MLSLQWCSKNVLDMWTDTLDDGGCVNMVYLDFAKAFDTVPHGRLIKKLTGYGVKGKVLDWVESFLSDWKQKVVVNGAKSPLGDVLLGIPQDCVLGAAVVHGL